MTNDDINLAVDMFNHNRPPHKEEPIKIKRSFSLRPFTQKKSNDELKAEEKRSWKQVGLILLVVVLCSCMLFGVVYTHVQKSELIRNIQRQQRQLAMEQSQNVYYQSELEKLASISEIDRYAVEELGMVKIQSNQIRYIDVAEYIENRRNDNEND